MIQYFCIILLNKTMLNEINYKFFFNNSINYLPFEIRHWQFVCIEQYKYIRQGLELLFKKPKIYSNCQRNRCNSVIMKALKVVKTKAIKKKKRIKILNTQEDKIE